MNVSSETKAAVCGVAMAVAINGLTALLILIGVLGFKDGAKKALLLIVQTLAGALSAVAFAFYIYGLI